MKSTSSNSAQVFDNLAITPEYGSGKDEDGRTFWPTPENAEYVSQYEPVKTKPIEADLDFKIERKNGNGNIVSIIGHSPDDGIWAPIRIGDNVYKRSVLKKKERHETIEWTTFAVLNIRYTDENRLLVDLLYSERLYERREEVSTKDDLVGEECIETVSAPVLCEMVAAESKTSKWNHNPSFQHPSDNKITRDRAYLPYDSDYNRVDSCDDLTFKEIDGEGSRKEVINQFLTGWTDNTVDHALGGVGGWKGAFGAFDESQNKLIGVITLTRHPNKKYADRTNEVMISRIACHPCRPKNTATWMIARARNWAEDQGYSQIGTTAGVGDNFGAIYKAAGFKLDENNTEWADGDGWTNRPGRTVVNGGNKWFKRKWVYELSSDPLYQFEPNDRISVSSLEDPLTIDSIDNVSSGDTEITASDGYTEYKLLGYSENKVSLRKSKDNELIDDNVEVRHTGEIQTKLHL